MVDVERGPYFRIFLVLPPFVMILIPFTGVSRDLPSMLYMDVASSLDCTEMMPVPDSPLMVNEGPSAKTEPVYEASTVCTPQV